MPNCAAISEPVNLPLSQRARSCWSCWGVVFILLPPNRPRARGSQPRYRALANEVALELSQHREDVEDQIAAGRLRVDLFREREELYAVISQSLYDLETVFE